MSVEGRLTIDLHRAGNGTGRARIASSRPAGIARVLVGALADDVVKTIPLLFNVCGLAQGAAAAQACERALGITTAPQTHRVRKLLVLAEMLREHLLRAVTDWSRFLGLEPKKDSTLRVMRFCTAARRALDPATAAFSIGAETARGGDEIEPLLAEGALLARDLVFGEPVESWRGRRTIGDLQDWSAAATTPAQQLMSTVLGSGWADAGRAELDFLPQLPEDDLAARLFGAESASFVSAPTWSGTPRETGALSRQAENPLVSEVMRVHGSGLLARLAGRLAEIAEVPRIMSDLVAAEDVAQLPAGSVPDGCGIAHVEAARGRLVHGVEIADAVVRRYAILAPTEWNFHPAGGAAHGLADIAARDGDVRALASLFVSSVDPCVGFEVRVH